MSAALAVAARPGAVVVATFDQLRAFTEMWLANRPLAANTRDAYRGDVHDFLRWCTDNSLHPMNLRFTHANRYARQLEEQPGPNGKPYKGRSVNRKLSAIKGWYTYLVRMEAMLSNPFADVEHATVDATYTPATALTAAEAEQVIAAAADYDRAGERFERVRLRNLAAITMLAVLGPRASELCNVDIADLARQGGHRTVTFHGKGGKSILRQLSIRPAEVLDAYLAERAATEGVAVAELSGPVFVTATGRRVTRTWLYRLVRALADAVGIAATIGPHDLRHTMATLFLDSGGDLAVLSHAMGHSLLQTTLHYDRNRPGRLARDPSATVLAAGE